LPIAVTRTDSAGASESMSFAYDGSMTTGITFTGTVNGSIGLTFDNNFWITSESVNGDTINFTYDNDGRTKSVGALTITRNIQNGFLTGTALDSIVDNYLYSNFGETTSYNAKVGAAAVLDVQYTRDEIGRITTRTKTIGGTTTVYEYSYDIAGRLVEVKEGGVVVSTYDYDANGNRITAVTKAGTFQGFYDLQDRITKYGDASYTYTANGELTSKIGADGTTSYNYDVYGNLRGATLPDGTSIEYVIDANNRRIGKKVNGILLQGFIYKDQLEPVAELDAAGAVVARFVYATRGHVPDYMVKGGVTYRIISDHLGSVRLVVNTTDGSIAQRIDYDEFGNITQYTNPGFQPFAFAGGIYDPLTKFTRVSARDYDPHTGRWTSKEELLIIMQFAALYNYSALDPVNYIDITGLALEAQSRGFRACTGKRKKECDMECGGSTNVEFCLEAVMLGSGLPVIMIHGGFPQDPKLSKLCKCKYTPCPVPVRSPANDPNNGGGGGSLSNCGAAIVAGAEVIVIGAYIAATAPASAPAMAAAGLALAVGSNQ